MLNSFISFLSGIGAFVLATFLEAVPFLLLGSLISSVVHVYVPDHFFSGIARRSGFFGVLIGLCGGLVFPTCECGVVPVVKRLILRGLPPKTAVTYMLAAPVINPLVIAATWTAFRGDLRMVVARVITTAIIAVAAGLSIDAAASRGFRIMKEDDPFPGDDGHSSCESCVLHAGECRIVTVLTHTSGEFFTMGSYFLLGAFAAALVKMFLPQEVLIFFSNDTAASILVMMALAVLLSVCSETDAFVANSLSFLPLASRLSFITLGPMVDIKLILMYLATFSRTTNRILFILPPLAVFLFSLVFHVLTGGI